MSNSDSNSNGDALMRDAVLYAASDPSLDPALLARLETYLAASAALQGSVVESASDRLFMQMFDSSVRDLGPAIATTFPGDIVGRNVVDHRVTRKPEPFLPDSVHSCVREAVSRRAGQLFRERAPKTVAGLEARAGQTLSDDVLGQLIKAYRAQAADCEVGEDEACELLTGKE